MSLRLLRKGLFYSLAGVYCTVTPLLILYSLGYIYAPGSERGIVKSGLVHIETMPAGADVHLEDKRFTQRTPATLQGLLPGDYQLTVTRKGYRPWKKLVHVRAEEAVVFDHILLLPKEWNAAVLSADEYTELHPTDGGRYFLLSKGPLAEDLWVYDRSQKKAKPATFSDPAIAPTRVLSAWPLDDGKKLSFHLRGPRLFSDDERLVTVDPAAETTVSDTLPAEFEKLINTDTPLLSGLLAEQRLTGWRREEGGQRLLVWSEGRLGVFDPDQEELRWHVRDARKIQQAFWVHQGSHALYRDGNTLYLIDLKDPQASGQEILQVKRGSSVVYRERSGRLYFLQKGSGHFCEIRLVEKNAI